MKQLFDEVSLKCSVLVTKKYSTSFSQGISFLGKHLHDPIYGIYGFVRLADEIVDSFQGYPQSILLKRFRKEAYNAIEERISLNPILNSFQKVVHDFKIPLDLVDSFLKSMEMDLDIVVHSKANYNKYIFGSAEVVGLMCLRVFTNGNDEQYEKLKPFARSLGAAFQKINFLRDLKHDFEQLGRTYFPGLDMKTFDKETKRKIENEIELDFAHALIGIKQLPPDSRRGVYLAYSYYIGLFNKIKSVSTQQMLSERIRIPSTQKVGMMIQCMVKQKLNFI